MATWRMSGQYLKNCSCIAFCTCDSDGDPSPHNFCEGVIGQHIVEGDFEGVDLSGLTYLIAFHFPGPLYEGNGTVEPYIEERANQQQRDALLQILSGKAGGTWFEVVSALAPNVKEPHFAPISWEFDKDQRRSRVEVPGLIDMSNAPILIRPTGDVNRVTVRIPGGIEYKEMEVSHTTIKSSGAIAFEWEKTSGGLADIVHTNSGLVA